MNVPPGLTCAGCGGLLSAGLARRTPAGWRHTADCPAEPWHGTLGGYTNRGCRDVCCRAARAADARSRRRAVSAARRAADQDPDASPDVLEGGAWVTVRGRSRWVPARGELVELEVRRVGRALGRRDELRVDSHRTDDRRGPVVRAHGQ